MAASKSKTVKKRKAVEPSIPLSTLVNVAKKGERILKGEQMPFGPAIKRRRK